MERPNGCKNDGPFQPKRNGSDLVTLPRVEARVAEDLAAIERRVWDTLDHPSAYLSYDWLRARSRVIRGRPRFIVVSGADGAPLVSIPSYLVDSASHPGYDPVRVLQVDDLTDADVAPEAGGPRILSEFRASLLQVGYPALVVSAPGRSGGISYRPGLDRGAREAAALAAVDAIERQAATDSASMICWLYFGEGDDDDLDRLLSSRGYLRCVVGAECYLPVTWSSFDGYVDSFSTRRRRTIRHEMAALAAAGARVDLHGAEVLGPELASLELQWRGKYARGADHAGTLADYAELQRHFGDGLRVFVASREGRALGFTVFLERDRTWYSRFGGFDYSAGKLYLYFNLLFYHPLQAALDRDITCIRHSIGAYETKRSRGCMLRNVLAYVRWPNASTASLVRAGLEVIDRSQRSRFTRIAS